MPRWRAMVGRKWPAVNINCFKSDPSIKSSLKFLRRTPWARKEVEAMYLASLDDDAPVEKADPGKLAEK